MPIRSLPLIPIISYIGKLLFVSLYGAIQLLDKCYKVFLHLLTQKTQYYPTTLLLHQQLTQHAQAKA